jgi:fructan beta-fructosidase
MRNEQYRPQIHFTPRENWMNDPNGPVYLNGTYHLFYQYNPEGNSWGNICWGHVRSEDLLHWEDLPIALRPDPVLGMPFSGSIVTDRENTSGLFDDGTGGLVALCTSVPPDDLTRQCQSVAFSRDGGTTWQLYPGNPVIANTGREHFRDPKVFRHDDSNSWIMVVAHGNEVLVYRSPDLLTWTRASAFGADSGSHAGIWECPDLFELPVGDAPTPTSRWVLVVGDGDHAPQDAGGTQYFVGTFDGWTFRNDNSPVTTLWADQGRDFYAAQSWYGLPTEQNRRVWIAWMSQWIYGHIVPTHPWRGTMCIPREVGLRHTPGGVRLTQQPVRELEKLRYRQLDVRTAATAGTAGTERFVIDDLRGTTRAVEVLGTIGPDQGHIRFDYTGGAALRIQFDRREKSLTVDRREVDGREFSPHFGGTNRLSLKDVPAGPLAFRIVLDRSTLEIFVADGLVASTDLIFPPGRLEQILLHTGVADPFTRVKAFSLRSV